MRKKFTRNKVFLYFLVLSIKGNLFIFPSCFAPLINNDTAQINPKSTNQRISGAFEVGGGRIPVITSCGGTSVKFTSIGLAGSYQIGYGFSKNFEAGGQFGGGIGQIISESEERNIIGNLTGLGYLKIGGSGGNFNFAIKLAPGVGILYSPKDIEPLPTGYADLMLGFGNPEKLTLYLGLENFIPRLGANLHFEKFSLFA
ncbi:MAG: hypothetical protein RRA63_05330 [Candidatus Calescibacterium sp.]|nr:hypothetical protein [Candidatus Calescibacterium sp.]